MKSTLNFKNFWQEDKQDALKLFFFLEAMLITLNSLFSGCYFKTFELLFPDLLNKTMSRCKIIMYSLKCEWFGKKHKG